METVIEIVSTAIAYIFKMVEAVLGIVRFVSVNGIGHIAIWLPLSLTFVVITTALIVIAKKRRSIVRAKSKSQKMYLNESNALYSKVAESDESNEKILEWAKSRRYMNGWAFELFVMNAMAKRLGDIAYMGDVKLTNDAGFDGVIVTKSKQIYFLQSKFYSNYLTKQTFTQLAKSVEIFNKRKATNNWHKVLGIPAKFSRNTEYTSHPVVAYTGKISPQNVELAKKLGVELVNWSDLISYIRCDKDQTKKPKDAVNGLDVAQLSASSN